jgi:CheY-like chemotaxis protein
MATTRILVVDDDAWILRMVTTVLEKRGYEIVIANDGEEAFQKALVLPPDLVITDVMMPKMDGWTLVKALRSKPEFAFVPMIFLTALGSDEDRIRGFRLGADDYLPKPFRFEELDLRVANALRRRQQVESSTLAAARATTVTPQPAAAAGSSGKPVQPSGIHGTLDQLGLSSLLMVLEMERKSGVLILARPSGGDTGRIFLRRGNIVRARIDGKAEPKNEQAIFHMLTWSEGRFEFSALEVDMEDEVKTSTTHLLMEGARRIDEAAQS